MATKNQKRTLAVIGFGRMGRRFTELLAPAFDVRVVSSRPVAQQVGALGATYDPDFVRAVSRAELILLAVPLAAFADLVSRLNDVAAEETIVFNVASAQVAAARKLARLKCRWFSIHAGAVIGEPDPDVLACLSAAGLDLRVRAAEEHDRLNSVTGLAHYVALASRGCLDTAAREELSTSPAGRHLLDLIAHVSNNAQWTYRETQIDNAFTRAWREDFLKRAYDLHSALSRGVFPQHGAEVGGLAEEPERVTVRRALVDEKAVMERLLQLYLYDFSEFNGSDINNRGLYEYGYFDDYFREAGRYPHFINCDGQLAGFVLVNSHTLLPANSGAKVIAEFFVMRKYRRHAVGRRAAFRVFDMFPGRWEVAEIAANVPAQLFWREVIDAYTDGSFEEVRLDNERWRGVIQSFSNAPLRGRR